jgi:glycosyltransferase involved in cell wall biosynthesis
MNKKVYIRGRNLRKIIIQRAFNLFTQYFNVKAYFKKKREIQNRSEKKRAIFIVGCERSGTTLMEKILDKHSKIAICPETHFWMDGFDKKIDNILNQNKSTLAKIEEIKNVVAEFKEFSDHWSEYNINPSELIDTNKISKADSIAIYNMIIEGQARKRGKELFGEKTPGHVFYVNNIIETYPNARIIQMIRDPRDTAVSRLKKRKEYSRNRLSKIMNALFVNIEWRLSSKLSRLYQQRLGDRYIAISFEELIQNPHETIQQICNFIEVDFQENMLDIEVINSSFSNKSSGFNSSMAKRWKKNLPGWLELIVNIINGREMELRGFNRSERDKHLVNQHKSKTTKDISCNKAPKYAIITPVRDEEENLPKLAECITNQTVLPKLWTIVDDNSTDSTPAIIDTLTKKYKWIQKTTKLKKAAYGHLSFSETVKTGYDYIIKKSKQDNIELEYIGKIDADIILPNNYFEELMTKFKDPNLGVACGAFYIPSEKHKESLQVFFIKGHLPDERLFRKKCLDDIGGFPVAYAADTIMLTKAKLKGWNTESFRDIPIHTTRDMIMSKGNWKGSKTEGYLRYYLDYPPMLVIFLSISKILQKRPYLSIITLFGYLEAIVSKKPKLDDKELREYFRKKRLKEVLNSFLNGGNTTG